MISAIKLWFFYQLMAGQEGNAPAKNIALVKNMEAVLGLPISLRLA
jgi:hypothetical protein